MKVEYVDSMGDDLSVVNAARVSFAKESDWKILPRDDYDGFGTLKDADAKLIKYLADHDHWTPFAHTAITLRMQAPIPIRTQCFKHKQGFVENEESRRYISSTPELFIPEFREKAEKVKQGSGEPHPDADLWRQEYALICGRAIQMYEDMIEDGVCPEQARFVLPQGVETEWIWTGNLYSYANFYRKRTSEDSQKEIRTLARMMQEYLIELFPTSWRALAWR